MRLAAAALAGAAGLAAAQQACVPGSDSPQGDLAGMPVAAADAAACRAKCQGEPACALYSFLERGCTYGPGPDGGASSACGAALAASCGQARQAGASECSACLVQHVSALGVAGCSEAAAQSFCKGLAPAPPCTLAGGCCYLKSEEVSGVAPKINSCACTGYVRAPPNGGFKPKRQPPAGAKNVLYVLVDDLRPELQPFGQSYAHTPNMQKLADGGTVFQNAYCQISVCSRPRWCAARRMTRRGRA